MDGDEGMKGRRFCLIAYIIVIITLFVTFTESSILPTRAYGALTIDAGRTGTTVKNSSNNKKAEEVAPIRKSNTKSQAKSASSAKTEASKAQIDISKIKNSGVTNFAFFGLDSRNPNQSSRSDCIMLVSIDKKNEQIKVTSLMRDMYVSIPGKGSNRINAAYAFGGPTLAVKTINTNLGLDIKDYVTVDYFGLEKLIDYLGGVKLNVSDAEARDLNNNLSEVNDITGYKVPGIKGGNQTLNGRQAVAYCRIRYVGNADYERTQRQRRVLNEILRKIKAGGISRLPKTVTTVLPYVKTSLSKAEILKYGIMAIGFKTDNIVQYRLPVDGTYKSQYIRGMAVLVPDINANKRKLYEFIYGIK